MFNDWLWPDIFNNKKKEEVGGEQQKRAMKIDDLLEVQR